MSTTYSVSPKVSELRADFKGHPSASILGGPLASGNKKLCIYYKTDANKQQITTITPVATRSNLTPKHSAVKVLSTAESVGLKSVFKPKSSKGMGTYETLGSKPMNKTRSTPGLLQSKIHVVPVITPQSQVVIQKANATVQSLPILQRTPQAAVSISQDAAVIQSGVSSFQGTQVTQSSVIKCQCAQVALPVLIQKPAEPQPVAFQVPSKVLSNSHSPNCTNVRNKFTIPVYQSPTVSKQSENIAVHSKTHELKLISNSVPKMQAGSAGTILDVNAAQFPVYHTEIANKDSDKTLGQVAKCTKKKEVVKRIVFSGLMSGDGQNVWASFKK